MGPESISLVQEDSISRVIPGSFARETVILRRAAQFYVAASAKTTPQLGFPRRVEKIGHDAAFARRGALRKC